MPSPATFATLAGQPLDEHEAIRASLPYLDAVGATAIVGMGLSPDSKRYLTAKVMLGADEGSIEVDTLADARAGEPLPRQALTLAQQLQDLAPTLVP